MFGEEIWMPKSALKNAPGSEWLVEFTSVCSPTIKTTMTVYLTGRFRVFDGEPPEVEIVLPGGCDRGSAWASPTILIDVETASSKEPLFLDEVWPQYVGWDEAPAWWHEDIRAATYQTVRLAEGVRSVDRFQMVEQVGLGPDGVPLVRPYGVEPPPAPPVARCETCGAPVREGMRCCSGLGICYRTVKAEDERRANAPPTLDDLYVAERRAWAAWDRAKNDLAKAHERELKTRTAK